jgi:hypothetical protein
MWREWTILAALPIGVGLAVLAAPFLRRALGALAGAVIVGLAAGAFVLIATSASFAALVVSAMAFTFALIGSGGAGRWTSRARPSPLAPDERRGAGGRGLGGGASGHW